MKNSRWLRRARPLLGTLVEVGCDDTTGTPAIDAAFAAVARVEARMSRFVETSDVSRFERLGPGQAFEIDRATADVLDAAAALHAASDGLFDVTLGSGNGTLGWRLEGLDLRKDAAGVRLDLGGIAKGYAVDQAIDALRHAGCVGGWVNAGGDLRAFGSIELPVWLRDEDAGGATPFAVISDGAFATSRFGGTSRANLCGARHAADEAWHVSVAAPNCLWADALTKLIAASGNLDHPLLAAHGAEAWRH